jgi:hypothetical protein
MTNITQNNNLPHLRSKKFPNHFHEILITEDFMKIPRVGPNSPTIFSFDLIEFSAKNDSIFKTSPQ